MKKFILIGIAIVAIISLLYATIKNVSYHNDVEISGGSHRIVVVVDPKSISGGTVVIDETYSLSGTKSRIFASVNIQVE